MLPYWLMFGLWGVGALQAERRRAQDRRVLAFTLLAVATALMIGLRFEVGGDWGAYARIYDDIYFLNLRNAMGASDPAYGALNWLSAQGDLGIWPVNVACGAIFMGGFAYLSWRQPNPFLMVLTAVPYLIIVVAMGYTRQAAAIGIICFAAAEASERKLFRIVIVIGIAALFHKTAILMLPILLLPILRRNAVFGLFGFILFAALAVLVLRDSSDRLITNYVQSSYDSQGAAIRIAMNVAAALLFLVLRKRIDLPPFQKSFWTTCAILALLFAPALAVASASAGIDRISLYFIPLQGIVLSRIPYALSQSRKALPSVLLAVVAYSFLVQFVWLNYADNAGYWVPYQMGTGEP